MARSEPSLHPVSPARRSLLAAVLLGVMLLSLAGAATLIHVRPHPAAATAPVWTGALPPKISLSLQKIPRDLQPLEGVPLNLPLRPLVAMYRSDHGATRRFYVFSYRGVDFRAPDALDQFSRFFFANLTGTEPAETIDATIDGRAAVEMRVMPRNGIGFIWVRSVLVFDRFYAIYYSGNSSPDEHDTDEFRQICDNMKLQVK